MIYLQLFLGFLKIGCFAFGGAYAAIPLMRDVVLANGWLNDETLSYMIAVSESTPGPVMVNLATYVGSSQGGILGALIATVSVVTPAFIIIIIAYKLMSFFTSNKYVKTVMSGLKSCVIGIILATGIYMLSTNLVSVGDSFSVDFKAVIIAGILALSMILYKCIFKKKLSSIALIAIAAVCGAVIYAI